MAEAAVTTLDRVSAEERALRIDVAAAFRLLHRHGMSDLAAGSLVARESGDEHSMLTHPHGLHFDEIRASDFIRVSVHTAFRLAWAVPSRRMVSKSPSTASPRRASSAIARSR